MNSSKAILLGLMGLILLGCERPEVKALEEERKSHAETKARASKEILKLGQTIKRLREEIVSDPVPQGAVTFVDDEETYRGIVRISTRLAVSSSPGSKDDSSWLMLKVQIPMQNRLFKTFGQDVVNNWTKSEIERAVGVSLTK
jgi:hypothetical protein